MKKPYVLNETYFSLAKKSKENSNNLNSSQMGNSKVHKTSKSSEFSEKCNKGYLFHPKRFNVYKDQTNLFSSFREHQSNIYSNDLKDKASTRKNLSRKSSLENELLSKGQFEWTIYTQKNNKAFKKNVKKLNKIETLFSEEDCIPNKKKENIDHDRNKNHVFITETNHSFFADSAINSNVLSNLIHTIKIRKFTCEYFTIPIKNKETPLKVSFSIFGASGNCEQIKLNIFGSTKTKFPNKFNAEFVYEV